ncbi:concanavalin A-like lectin/glucanase, partial [Tanacetum coccineum]
GVVLLEVLCRKRAVFNIDEQALNLAIWAQESIKEGKLKHIIDSDLRGEISPKCLKEYVRIAERCLHSNPKQRSTMAEVLVCLESILILQEKFNNSVLPAGRTILDRMVNMLPFPSNGEKTAQGDSNQSSEGNSRIGTNTVGADNNTFLDTSEIPADYEARSLKEFDYDDLKKATKKFSPYMLLGEGTFGKVYLGWVDQNTFAPSKHDVGVPVAVKRLNQKGLQGHSEWQASRDGPNAPNTDEPLSWGTRLIILMGVARGLVYLHSSQNQIMHRGVTSRDILLDKDFTAKLADFGFAKSSPKIGESHVSTSVIGAFGYVDPAYVTTATSVRKEFDQSTSSSGLWSQPCRQFEFPEILLATENFNESLVVGSGGFGKVYKGNIVNGSSLVVVAIKRLDSIGPKPIQP